MKKKALLCGLALTGLFVGAGPSEAQSPVVVSSPTTTGSTTSAAKPLPESNLKTELRLSHEDLRRMEGALHDLDREAGPAAGRR